MRTHISIHLLNVCLLAWPQQRPKHEPQPQHERLRRLQEQPARQDEAHRQLHPAVHERGGSLGDLPADRPHREHQDHAELPHWIQLRLRLRQVLQRGRCGQGNRGCERAQFQVLFTGVGLSLS